MNKPLDPDYLLDLYGGVYRFPAQPGIYALVFNPGDDGRTYVGASKNIRQRIQTHVKGTYTPPWAIRLALNLVVEEMADPGKEPWTHPMYAGFIDFARRSVEAQALELFDHGTPKAVIAAAENRWIEKLSPALNAPGRTKGGYC